MNSIHHEGLLALPPQVPTEKIPFRITPSGHCRICGDRDRLTPDLSANYPGERECERFECESIITLCDFVECACCGEILIEGSMCSTYMNVWTEASYSVSA